MVAVVGGVRSRDWWGCDMSGVYRGRGLMGERRARGSLYRITSDTTVKCVFATMRFPSIGGSLCGSVEMRRCLGREARLGVEA